MTQQQDADIRDYLDRKVVEVEASHKTLKNWLISIIFSLMAIFVLVGAMEVRTTQRNKDQITILREWAQYSVRHSTIYQMNRTYELEFQAITALMDEDIGNYSVVMKEFHDLRWQIMEDELKRNKEVFRGTARKAGSGSSGASN